MKREQDIEKLFEQVKAPELKPDLKQQIFSAADPVPAEKKRGWTVFRYAAAAMILLTVMFNALAGRADKKIHDLSNGASFVQTQEQKIRKEFGLPVIAVDKSEIKKQKRAEAFAHMLKGI